MKVVEGYSGHDEISSESQKDSKSKWSGVLFEDLMYI